MLKTSEMHIITIFASFDLFSIFFAFFCGIILRKYFILETFFWTIRSVCMYVPAGGKTEEIIKFDILENLSLPKNVKWNYFHRMFFSFWLCLLYHECWIFLWFKWAMRSNFYVAKFCGFYLKIKLAFPQPTLKRVTFTLWVNGS